MKSSTKNGLILGFIFVAFIVGFIGFKNSLPEEKNQKLYPILQEYFPYTLQKRFGGLEIVYKDGRDVQKPKNTQIFHITDEIEKEWAKEYLLLQGNILIILDDNKKEIKKLQLDGEELLWLKEYFGI